MGEPLLLQLFIASSIPVVKILLICTVGAFCARKGLLTAEGRRMLGAISFLVFNPCLIFVKLGSTLTPARLLHWWPLVLNTGISTAVGLALGYLGIRLVRPPHALRMHTVVAIALGNLGNLPLVIVSSLASSSTEVLGGIPAGRAEDLAVSYVVLGLLIPVIAQGTIGFSMLRKPNSLELPQPQPTAEGPDGFPQTPRTATLAAVAAAAAAGAATSASGDAAGPSAEARGLTVVRDAAEGESRIADGVAVVDAVDEQQKRPLLAEYENGVSSAVGSELTSSWVAERADEGAAATARGGGAGSSGGGDCRRRAPRLSASGAAAALPRLSPSLLLAARRSESGGLMAAGKLWDQQPEQHQQNRHEHHHHRRPSADGGSVGQFSAPHSPQPRSRRSSTARPGVLDIDSVPLYGCALDCLGQSDADPLLPPQPQPHPLQPLPLGMEVDLHSCLGDGTGPHAASQQIKAHSAAEKAVAVELPPLEGARLVPDPSGSSSAELLRSASGRRTLGRLSRSVSGRRLLLEWHSRIDYRALARQVVRELTAPPVAAILLSVSVGCVRRLQEAFFGGPEGDTEAPPLGLVTDCLTMLGDCTIPAILLNLGATLANGPGAARVPLRIISLVNLTRLALLPLLGLGLVMGAYAARMFEAPDPIYLLVLLIQNTAPTAILVHTMSSVHANRPEEVSTIMFWGYISSIAIIPLWLTLFLYVVKQMYRKSADGGIGVQGVGTAGA